MSTLFKIQIIDSFVPIFKIGKKYEVCTTQHSTQQTGIKKLHNKKITFFPSKTFKNQI